MRPNERNRRWWTLAAMCCGLFMAMLDSTAVSVALPSIQVDFGSSLAGLGWTSHAYMLPFGVLLVTAGRLGDVLGRRRLFLVGVVGFAGSSAAIGLAPTQAWLIAGRAVQGVAGACMLPASLSLVAHAFPPSERGKAIGTWAGISATALALGPVLGGALSEYVSWRAIFFLNLPVAVAAVALTLLATPESRDETVTRRVDWAGVATLSLGLTALVLALVQSGAWGWTSPAIVGLLAGAALALGAFALVESRVPAPIVDFAAFRSRTFLGANAIGFLLMVATFGAFFFNALYLQVGLGYSPVEAGVRFLPSTLTVALTAPLAGRLADRFGARWPATGGMLTIAAGLALETQLSAGSGYGLVLPAFVLLGAGSALVVSPLSAAAINSVHAGKAGAASGIFEMSRMVGGTLGVATFGAIAGRVATTSDAFVDALARGMWLATAVALLGAALAATTIGNTTQRSEEMVRMYVRHQVSDYGRWRAGHDAFDDRRLERGVIGHGVFRHVRDPLDVTVSMDFETTGEAEAFAAFIGSGAQREAMHAGGVVGDPQIWLVEEV